MHKDTLARVRELGFATYTDYLASPLWESNKLRMRKRKRCWLCGSTKNLHWHHRSYDRLGAETADDIVVLCERHHSGLHDYMRKNGIPLINAHKSYKSFLAGYGDKPQTTRSKRGRRKYTTGGGMNTRLGKKRFVQAFGPVRVRNLYE